MAQGLQQLVLAQARSAWSRYWLDNLENNFQYRRGIVVSSRQLVLRAGGANEARTLPVTS
jgi:hypothetical protein